MKSKPKCPICGRVITGGLFGDGRWCAPCAMLYDNAQISSKWESAEWAAKRARRSARKEKP